MKTFITAIVLAAGSVGAFATEYTNFEIPASVLTRAEVRAAINSPNANGIVIIGEATQFVPSSIAMVPSAAKAADVMVASRPNSRSASFPSNTVPGRS